jgi:hypothetical protein
MGLNANCVDWRVNTGICEPPSRRLYPQTRQGVYVLRTIPIVILASVGLASPAMAGEYVVVNGKAPLYTRGTTKAQRIGPLSEARLTLKKLSSKKGWVEVEANGPLKSREHCAAAPWSLEPLALRLWVRESELLPVTAKSVTIKHSDGTRLTASAGVPLSKSKGEWLAELGGHQWPISLKSSEVAKSFSPAPMAKRGRSDWMTATVDIQIGGSAINGTKGDSFDVLSVMETDGKTRYRISGRCFSAVVAGGFEDPPEGVGGLGMLGALMGGDGKDYWQVKKGTEVYWPTGESAGYFKRDSFIHDSEQVGERICAKFGHEPEVQTCVAAKDAVRKKAQVLSKDVLDSGKLSDLFGEQPEISENVVRRVVEHRRKELDQCFAKGAGRNGGLVLLSFEVGPDGRVNKPKLDPKPSSGAEACVLLVLNDLMFQARKSRKPQRVTHTFQTSR